mgnify:CR=1 FL=1
MHQSRCVWKKPRNSFSARPPTFAVRGLSQVAVAGRKAGVNDADVNRFTLKAIFSTLTNVNFDPVRLQSLIKETAEKREELRRNIAGARGNCQFDDPAAIYQPAIDIAGLIKQGEEVRLPVDW